MRIELPINEEQVRKPTIGMSWVWCIIKLILSSGYPFVLGILARGTQDFVPEVGWGGQLNETKVVCTLNLIGNLCIPTSFQ